MDGAKYSTDMKIRTLKNAVVVMETKKLYESSDISTQEVEGTEGVVKWGANNLLPNEILDIVGKNAVAEACLDFKTEVAYGQGIEYGVMIDGKFEKRTDNAEVNEFIEDNDINGMLSEMFVDIHYFYMGNVEIILNKDIPEERKIVTINHLESIFSRWEKADDKGRINNLVYSTEWEKTVDKDNSTTIPVLDATRTYKDLAIKMGRIPPPGKTDAEKKDENKYKYVVPISLPSPGKKYYPRPPWYSLIEGKWLAYANSIPEFKTAMMNNSMTLIYHVEINLAYFDRIFTEEQITDPKEQQDRVEEKYKEIEDFLQGETNSGKSLITYFKVDEHGEKKEESDIKITVIDRKVGGEYLEDTQESSAMIFTGMRENPSLIGVIPGKTSGSMGGSDKRELYNIKQLTQGRIRDRVLRPLKLVQRVNKWNPELVFRIGNIQLTTLDEGTEAKPLDE